MNVTVEKVAKKEAGSFRSLAPSHILISIGDPGIFTVSAIALQGTDRSVVGILQYRIVDEECRITWLFVDEDFRRIGVGKLLLSFLYNDMKDLQIRQIKFLLYHGLSRNVDINAMADYLLNAGFDEKREAKGPYYFSGKALFEQFSLKQMEGFDEFSKSAISFAEMTSESIADAAASLGIKNSRDILMANKEVSCLYKKQGATWGILAFKKRGNLYSLLLLEAKDKEVEKKLFGYAIYLAFRKLKVEDNIAIYAESEKIDWISDVLPDLQRREAILVTKTVL